MSIPNYGSRFLISAAIIVATITLATRSPTPAVAQGVVELEESLFVQNPHLKNAKGIEVPGVLEVVSVPQPIQKYCLGKTTQECATIDYCIRTTTKSVAMCQSLPANLRHLPPYPAGMRPIRVFSISFFQGAPNIKGFDALRQFYDNAPKGSLDVFSTQARFKGKVRLTPKATDEDFELLEVLTVPSP